MSDALRIILLICGGGAVGGLLYWTSLYQASLSAEGDADKVFPGTRAFLFAQMFTGGGGAWAVILAMTWAHRTPFEASLESELQLFATCMVAGYAGNRLLPAVADQLTRQLLKETERKTARNAIRAKRSELTAEVYTYLDIAGSQNARQTAMYEQKLRAELNRDPANRKAAILLARLFAEADKAPEKAIEVLEAFIANKNAGGATPDADVADSYWNLANYYEDQYLRSGERERRWRLSAIEAIAAAISITPSYMQNLVDDSDFQSLRQDAETKKKLPALIG